MADLFGYSALPGPGAVSITNERQAVLGPITWYLLKGGVIDGSAASDAGNTPTTELRHGLLMGEQTADGLLAEYSGNATDGTGVVAGFLWEPRSTIDSDGLTVDRPCQIVIAAYARASQLIGLDEQARRQMQGRFILDDRPLGPVGGFTRTVAKASNYTVTVADNDTHFTNAGAAGAVTFTLPAVAKGLRYRFTATADQTITVTAPAGKLIAFNSAAATSVAFSTATQKVGGTFEIVANDDGTKYIAIPSGSNTVTVA